MSIIEKLNQWRVSAFRNNRDKDYRMPIRRDEIVSILSNMETFTMTKPERSSVMGFDTFESPFAEEMRGRQVEMETLPYMAEHAEARFVGDERTHQDHARRALYRTLTAFITTDTTEINLEFEWDVFARLKRFLRITKWLPIKNRKVVLDAKVLYPYLKISLPHNRHHVKFAVRRDS